MTLRTRVILEGLSSVAEKTIASVQESRFVAWTTQQNSEIASVIEEQRTATSEIARSGYAALGMETVDNSTTT